MQGGGSLVTQVDKALCIDITSFSSIPYWSNSEYWPQKQSQSGNIHSITLDVHVSWQSAQNFLLDDQAQWVSSQGYNLKAKFLLELKN